MDYDHDEVENRLLSRRQQLQTQSDDNREARETVELDQTSVGRLSRMDAMQGQAMALAQQRRRDLELRRISSALQRLKAGEYGDCPSCGEAIASQRLIFDPAATLCIDCAEQRSDTA